MSVSIKTAYNFVYMGLTELRNSLSSLAPALVYLIALFG